VTFITMMLTAAVDRVWSTSVLTAAAVEGFLRHNHCLMDAYKLDAPVCVRRDAVLTHVHQLHCYASVLVITA
jgi:hypothetical protein